MVEDIRCRSVIFPAARAGVDVRCAASERLACRGLFTFLIQLLHLSAEGTPVNRNGHTQE